MVATTNHKYGNSSLNYYVIMTVQKIFKFKFLISNIFCIFSEARSAEFRQTITASRLFLRATRREATSKRSAVVTIQLCGSVSTEISYKYVVFCCQLLLALGL